MMMAKYLWTSDPLQAECTDVLVLVLFDVLVLYLSMIHTNSFSIPGKEFNLFLLSLLDYSNTYTHTRFAHVYYVKKTPLIDSQ